MPAYIQRKFLLYIDTSVVYQIHADHYILTNITFSLEPMYLKRYLHWTSWNCGSSYIACHAVQLPWSGTKQFMSLAIGTLWGQHMFCAYFKRNNVLSNIDTTEWACQCSGKKNTKKKHICMCYPVFDMLCVEGFQ